MTLPVIITALVLAGCTRPQPRPAGPLEVRVVSLPSRPGCYLPDVPEPPADLELNFEDEDVIRRTTVNIRQHNLALQWQRDLMHWVGEAQGCINRLTGGEP